MAALAAYPLPPPAAASEAQQEGGGEVARGAGCPPGGQAGDELADKRDLLLSALRAVWG